MSLSTFLQYLQVAKGAIASLVTSVGIDASAITSGTIDAARLPSYVDDVLEYANLAAFPVTGTSGKIYVALDTDISYRWAGSAYRDLKEDNAGVIHAATEKVTLADDDELGWVDSAASYVLKKVKASSLYTYIKTKLLADGIPVKVISDATYTLQDSDKGKILRFTSASAVTFTIDTAQAVAGFNFTVIQAGAGQITWSGTATKSNLYSATKTIGQNACAGFLCSVAGTFHVTGDVV